MNMIAAFAIVYVAYAVGDVISQKTKGYLSSMFFCFVFYLVGFWTFLPTTLLSDSGLTTVAFPFLCLLMVNMGTTINLRELTLQWKTIIIAFCICAFLCIGPMLIVPLFMDKMYAYIGAPVLSGAITATLIMQEAAERIGRTDLVVFASAVLAIQNLVGIPLASFCLKKESACLLADFRNGVVGSDLSGSASKKNVGRTLIPALPAKYLTNNVIVAKVAVIAFIAYFASNHLFAGRINAMIWCLLLGILFKSIGFLEENSMSKASGLVFIFSIPLLNSFTGLASATPKMIMGQILPLVLLFVVALITAALVALVLSKIFKCSWYIAMAIGSTSLFGFPITLILSNEIANTSGKTEAEREYLRSILEPIMVIAGIITVTISSVFFAGIIANMI